MKNKKEYFTITLIFVLLTELIGIGISLASRDMQVSDSSPNLKTSATISTIADHDSYVISGFPDDNYGDEANIQFGLVTQGHYEVYIHFNFTDKPSDWDNAEISLDVYYLNLDSDTFNVSVSLVEAAWEESSIIWNNKPDHGQIIKNLNMTEEKAYNINVSEYIEGDGISICINTSATSGVNLGRITSSEGYDSESDAPRLIWTYEDSGDDEDDGGDGDEMAIPSYPLLISMPVIGFTMAGLFYYIRKKLN